ncbi:MAG TPA: HD domain-containing protein [Candidatus Andersenbacteria bacterium]|nr:HD domain-containing protein [Candidatus Andersenbacteria bacterium]
MQLPQEVQSVITQLQTAGFEAYAVGGCVRDLLLGKEPKDWDVTTSANPAEIQKVFPNSFYTNTFGTVTVRTGATPDPLQLPLSKGEGTTSVISEIEVTTYRIDAGYNDQRHPDSVTFTKSIREDLARRDFTINAMAMTYLTPASPSKGEGSTMRNPSLYEGEGKRDEVTIDNMQIIDPFGGLKDLHNRIIRAVGNPSERFTEDALRLMRAIRFSAQLGFEIEEYTLRAITEYAPAIEAVSHERIRDEFVKIIMSRHPEPALNLLQQTGLLAVILPEVAEGVGIGQNKHHVYTVFEHCVKSLQFAAEFEYPLHVRIAALFHDIGKPRTRRFVDTDYTFYGHEIVGAHMTESLMKRLKFPSDITKQVTHLVRHHMFYYDVGKVTPAGARRLLRRVGKDNFDDLIKLRIAERKGSGVPKAEPYRLRHLQFMVEQASKEPISVGQLAVTGNDLIHKLGLRPGPMIGGILHALLAEVLEDPKKNDKAYLLEQAKALQEKTPEDLKKLGEEAIAEEEKKQEEEIKRKYHV